MDPEAIEEIRDQIIENIGIILTKIDICTESGMIDEKSEMHNLAYELREDTDEVETPLELGEIINKCKTMETTLDGFLANKGLTTIALTWPNVEE